MILALFRLIPGSVWLGLGLACAVILGLWAWDMRGDELARLRAAQEQRAVFDRMDRAADDIERQIVACPPGKWDRKAKTCAPDAIR